MMISSSWHKNRERSFGVIGAGPPVTVPDCRSTSIKSRMASDAPMSCSVKGRPRGPKTRACLAKQRDASGMSAVTTITPNPACSAIQSSTPLKLASVSRPPRQKRLDCCAAFQAISTAIIQSSAIHMKRIEFSARKRCVEKRMRISGMSDGHQRVVSWRVSRATTCWDYSRLSAVSPPSASVCRTDARRTDTRSFTNAITALRR